MECWQQIGGENMKKFQIGQSVLCFRGDFIFKGQVLKEYDNSLLVEIDDKIVDALSITTNRTVVNKKNIQSCI